MKAFVIDGYGGSDKVHEAEIPEPALGRSDVLIEVRAAGVNPLDLKIRDGALKALLKLSFPVVLGNDVAGVVKRAGANVGRFQAGDEVYARTDTKRMGGFAERVAVDADSLSLKPRTLSMTQAAAVPLVALDGMAGAGREGEGRAGTEGARPWRARVAWGRWRSSLPSI